MLGFGSSCANIRGWMRTSIDVILVDDHRLFREGLRRLLSTDPRFRVMGEASNGEEFLALLDRLLGSLGTHTSPALPLIFMDIDMPGIGGIEATKRALELYPELRIVAISMHGDEEFRDAMLAAGAVGFLAKDSTLEQVVGAALAAVGLDGSKGAVPSLPKGSPTGQIPELVEGRRPERSGDSEGQTVTSSEAALSAREREVLPLICAGLSTHQIAERLFISPRTVDKHRANILDKTLCPNTASLVVWAVRRGLIAV